MIRLEAVRLTITIDPDDPRRRVKRGVTVRPADLPAAVRDALDAAARNILDTE